MRVVLIFSFKSLKDSKGVNFPKCLEKSFIRSCFVDKLQPPGKPPLENAQVYSLVQKQFWSLAHYSLKIMHIQECGCCDQLSITKPLLATSCSTCLPIFYDQPKISRVKHCQVPFFDKLWLLIEIFVTYQGYFYKFTIKGLMGFVRIISDKKWLDTFTPLMSYFYLLPFFHTAVVNQKKFSDLKLDPDFPEVSDLQIQGCRDAPLVLVSVRANVSLGEEVQAQRRDVTVIVWCPVQHVPSPLAKCITESSLPPVNLHS